MSDISRYLNLRFEIQHLFPSEIRSNTSDANAVRANQFLVDVGFDLEWRGNKMALLATPAMRDALLNAPEAVQQAFRDAGFGFNTQNSYRNPNAHPQYNAFIIDALAELSAQADDEGWEKQARARAVYDFHRYVTQVNADGFPPVQGTEQGTFAQQWAAYRGNKDYADVSTYNEGVVDDYRNSFDVTLIDDGASNNNEMRRDIADALISNLEGVLIEEQIANAQRNLDKGNVTQAVSSLIHDAQLLSSTPVVGNAIAAEAWAAKLWPDLSEYFNFDELIDKISGLLDYFADRAGELVATIDAIGEFVSETIGKSINSILVGVGGGVIGDIVEFLNVVYEPFKEAVKTGDWGPVWSIVGQYGVAAVFSGLLVVGSVALATAVGGPVAGGFVAAGWTLLGLYDAISNGVELFNKISADLTDIIPKIGETIEEEFNNTVEYYKKIRRVVAFAMDVDFDDPVFAGSETGRALATRYLVDPLDPSLPGRISGTAEDEQFYGQNGAIVNGAGGNDEIYLRHGGTARGGSGQDIVVGSDRQPANGDWSGGGGSFGGGGAGGGWEGPDTPIVPELTLTLDGGADNDWVIAIGGENATIIGGLGRDWIYNSSENGIIWGDALNSYKIDDNTREYIETVTNADGTSATRRVQFNDDSSNADNFWYASDTTIMDAGDYDVLKFYGIPMVGLTPFGPAANDDDACRDAPLRGRQGPVMSTQIGIREEAA